LSRRSIILLSDGVDSGGVSGVSAEETLALADQSDAIIFTIGLGPTIDEAYLTQLAARGRGQYLRAPTPEQLTSVYQSVGSILRNQYVVEFDASAVDQAAAAGQPLTVTVNVGGVTSSAQAAVSVPVVATPVATPVATEGTATGGEEESSGGFPVLIAVAAVVGALALVGGALLLLRRRRRSGTTRAIEMDVKRFRQKDAAPVTAEIARAVEPEEAMAWLVLPDGIKKPLGMTPVTIGYSADCTVKLDGGNAPSMERVRVWWRDGNFMLHNLSRAGRVSIGGKPVTWVVLEDGDEVEIGSQMVRFVETGSGGEDGNGQT
jgi:hypothetical protein